MEQQLVKNKADMGQGWSSDGVRVQRWIKDEAAMDQGWSRDGSRMEQRWVKNKSDIG